MDFDYELNSERHGPLASVSPDPSREIADPVTAPVNELRDALEHLYMVGVSGGRLSDAPIASMATVRSVWPADGVNSEWDPLTRVLKAIHGLARSADSTAAGEGYLDLMERLQAAETAMRNACILLTDDLRGPGSVLSVEKVIAAYSELFNFLYGER